MNSTIPQSRATSSLAGYDYLPVLSFVPDMSPDQLVTRIITLATEGALSPLVFPDTTTSTQAPNLDGPPPLK
jgi:hypothetical protein